MRSTLTSVDELVWRMGAVVSMCLKRVSELDEDEEVGLMVSVLSDAVLKSGSTAVLSLMTSSMVQLSITREIDVPLSSSTAIKHDSAEERVKDDSVIFFSVSSAFTPMVMNGR